MVRFPGIRALTHVRPPYPSPLKCSTDLGPPRCRASVTFAMPHRLHTADRKASAFLQAVCEDRRRRPCADRSAARALLPASRRPEGHTESVRRGFSLPRFPSVIARHGDGGLNEVPGPGRNLCSRKGLRPGFAAAGEIAAWYLTADESINGPPSTFKNRAGLAARDLHIGTNDGASASSHPGARMHQAPPIRRATLASCRRHQNTIDGTARTVGVAVSSTRMAVVPANSLGGLPRRAEQTVTEHATTAVGAGKRHDAKKRRSVPRSVQPDCSPPMKSGKSAARFSSRHGADMLHRPHSSLLRPGAASGRYRVRASRRHVAPDGSQCRHSRPHGHGKLNAESMIPTTPQRCHSHTSGAEDVGMHESNKKPYKIPRLGDGRSRNVDHLRTRRAPRQDYYLLPFASDTKSCRGSFWAK